MSLNKDQNSSTLLSTLLQLEEKALFVINKLMRKFSSCIWAMH